MAFTKNTKNSKKEPEKTPLTKGQASFNLIGETKLTDFSFKIDEQSGKSDWVYNQLNLGVDCGNGNVVYGEMMGGYGAERDNYVYVHGKKENEKGKLVDDYKNKFKIDWEDRLDETILETVGDQCFITVGLEKDKNDKTFAKKFLSVYDAIAYIKENLTNGTVVNVKGNLTYTIYNNTVQTKKEIKSIFLSNADDKSKYKAVFTQTVLLDKDSVSKVDKEKAVYYIDAKVIDYTKLYNGKEVKTNIPFSKTFELEVNKERPEATKAFLDKVLRVKSGITSATLEGDIVEGQSLVTVSEDDIPEDVKALIEMGVYTKEEIVGKLSVGGTKEKRMVIRKPHIKILTEGENKTTKIDIEPNRYKEEDLIFDFMFEDEEQEDDGKPPFDLDDDKDSDDDNDWMNKL